MFKAKSVQRGLPISHNKERKLCDELLKIMLWVIVMQWATLWSKITALDVLALFTKHINCVFYSKRRPELHESYETGS